MPKNLVIVESPAKAKTVEKYLGKDYRVESSYGHVCDLVQKDMGIEINNNFKPIYEVPSDKKAVVAKLRQVVKLVDMVWLASDEDREGEAIAWHLFERLRLKKKSTRRIVFHEITKSAILRSIENPRDINLNLVDAQQARRVLDRIVGFELSPVLWRKVKTGLSAGRVQSVAVRLIVEKERKIQKFDSKSYFRVVAVFRDDKGNKLKSELSHRFDTEKQALEFLEQCDKAIFFIKNLEIKKSKRAPAPPFTTSTLQQEASRKLGFSVGQTMSVAQRLYESGFITYMRTDSLNLSDEAIKNAQNEIVSRYGKQYSFPQKYTTKNKAAQEAHEAIRPTQMSNEVAGLDNAQHRLYSLIWKRTIASQMVHALLEKTTIKVNNDINDYLFITKGEVVLFDGFLKVYLEDTDDEDAEEKEGMLPKVSVGDKLEYDNIVAQQRFTKPPARYTEASLVKKMEELGIGRPSTYAPTISTIQKRGYVEKSQLKAKERDYKKIELISGNITQTNNKEIFGADKGKLVPKDIGMVVNDFLVDRFDKVMNYSFTAKVEEDFDEIARGNQPWHQVIKSFYDGFHRKVEQVKQTSDRVSGERLLGEHPDTGKPIMVRLGKFGPMAQMGEASDEDKKFASLQKNQSLETVTLQDVLKLFALPKSLGDFKGEEVMVSSGRYGPYIRYGKMYVSMQKTDSPYSMDFDRAVELIKAKQDAEAPIAHYEESPVQKGVGRFGPYIKWNNTFISVNKKYDFDNLTLEDVTELIEERKRKDRDKIIHDWKDEGIRVERARWGRSQIIKGKIKIELPKTVDASGLTLDEVKSIIDKRKTPKSLKNQK